MSLKAQVGADAGKDQSICVYDSLNVIGLGLNAGDTGYYQWTDLSNGSVTNSQTLIRKNLPSGYRTFELTVSRIHNGKTYIARDSFILTVYGLPQVRLNPTDTICATTKPFLLNSILPGAWQGSWSGPGVSNNQLDPSFASKNNLFAGPYTLKFIYTHPLTNCTNSDSEKIYIQNAPIVTFSNNNPYHFCEGQVVQLNTTQQYAFSARYSTNGDGVFKNINSLNTDYFHGNRDTSVGQISIMITSDSVGVCGNAKSTLDVIFEKSPRFTMPPHFVYCEPSTVSFSSHLYKPSNVSNVRYSWWFGNGDSLINSTDGNPQSIKYPQAKVGWYDVRLKVSNQWGSQQGDYCSTQVDSIDYVRILPTPKAEFTSTPDFLAPISHPEFEFKNNSSIRNGWDISYARWQFSSTIANDTSSLKNPTHQYPTDTGAYQVLLIATYAYFDYSTNTSYTCSDSLSEFRKVVPNSSSEIQILTLTQNTTLQLQLPFLGTLKVLDINGRVKEQYSNNAMQQRIDISQWPAGIYLFLLTEGSIKKSMPFIKF